MLELSNYWDDFKIRVNNTIDCLNGGKLPQLERLTVHLTEGCNFNCEYCNMHFSKKTMDKNLVVKIIDDYVRMGGRTIHFTGGEPSIVEYIEEVFQYAKKKGLTVSANTNAFTRMNCENIDKLKTSFDTPYGNVFNATVRRNSFETVVENMKYYSKEMKEKMLSITAVLNRKTYKSMLKLAQFVNENFDVYNLYYSNYKGSDKTFAFTDEEIKDMFENYIPETLKFLKESGNYYSYKQLSLYKPSDFIDADCRFEENKTIPCYIQLSEMTIDVDGNCYNCSHLYRDGVKSPIKVNVNSMNLKDCFITLKSSLNGNYTFLSDKCLNGCNTNLIGFNKAVSKKEKIYN